MSALHLKPRWSSHRSFAAESDRSTPPAEWITPLLLLLVGVLRLGKTCCVTEIEAATFVQWLWRLLGHDLYIDLYKYAMWQRYNARNRKRQEERLFLLLPVQMKENDTMLPKRSHCIIWFTVKSSKRTLRASGLTSELYYCSSQRDVWVVIIGSDVRMERSSILCLSGRSWLTQIEYPAASDRKYNLYASLYFCSTTFEKEIPHFNLSTFIWQ